MRKCFTKFLAASLFNLRKRIQEEFLSVTKTVHHAYCRGEIQDEDRATPTSLYPIINVDAGEDRMFHRQDTKVLRPLLPSSLRLVLDNSFAGRHIP